jgi:hypothetical protein
MRGSISLKTFKILLFFFGRSKEASICQIPRYKTLFCGIAEEEAIVRFIAMSH